MSFNMMVNVATTVTSKMPPTNSELTILFGTEIYTMSRITFILPPVAGLDLVANFGWFTHLVAFAEQFIWLHAPSCSCDSTERTQMCGLQEGVFV